MSEAPDTPAPDEIERLAEQWVDTATDRVREKERGEKYCHPDGGWDTPTRRSDVAAAKDAFLTALRAERDTLQAEVARLRAVIADVDRLVAEAEAKGRCAMREAVLALCDAAEIREHRWADGSYVSTTEQQAAEETLDRLERAVRALPDRREP